MKISSRSSGGKGSRGRFAGGPLGEAEAREVNATSEGRLTRVRRWFVDREKDQLLWIDRRGVIVAFQTEKWAHLLSGAALARPADINLREPATCGNLRAG